MINAKTRLLASYFGHFISTESAWWSNLSTDAKVEYLKTHPGSRKDKGEARSALSRAYRDESARVRKSAISHPHASDALLRRALEDDDESVARMAQRLLDKRAK